ncbi:Uncharacterised protein [uncultured archaeon]|nr:Uncharacterised protein [uncultured archaeon]
MAEGESVARTATAFSLSASILLSSSGAERLSSRSFSKSESSSLWRTATSFFSTSISPSILPPFSSGMVAENLSFSCFFISSIFWLSESELSAAAFCSLSEVILLEAISSFFPMASSPEGAAPVFLSNSMMACDCFFTCSETASMETAFSFCDFFSAAARVSSVLAPAASFSASFLLSESATPLSPIPTLSASISCSMASLLAEEPIFATICCF